MILHVMCYFELSTGILHFNIKKNPGKGHLHGFGLPFPFCENADINCSSKIFFPSLGGSRWVLGIHGGGPLSPKPLGHKCYWTTLLLLPSSGDSSRPSVPEDPPGWSCPAGMVVRWGVGWAEDMDRKCLCVSCCLGSHLDAAKRTSEEEECSLGPMVSAHHVRAQFTWISFSCLLALWSLLWATENEQIQYGRTECRYWGTIRCCGSIREGNLIHISVVSKGPFLGEQMARRRHEPE